LLNGYISDDNSINSDIKWSIEGNKYVHAVFANGKAEVALYDEHWTGSETVTLVATDENGAELRIPVTFTVPKTTTVCSIQTFSVSISPVPVADACTVSFSSVPESPVTITVLSADGKTAALPSLRRVPATSIAVDIATLPAGTYHIKVETDRFVAIEKITKE